MISREHDRLGRCDRRVLLLLSTMLASGVAIPALAQNAPMQAAPPVRTSLDQNQVDLASGTVTIPVATVTIGDSAQGGLSYTRYQLIGGWRDNHIGQVKISGSLYSVIIGVSTHKFVKSGSTFTSQEADGATLTQSGSALTYTSSLGEVATFDMNMATGTSSGSYTYGSDSAVITSLKTPMGDIISYIYRSQSILPPSGPAVTYRRLQSIVSTSGYHIKLTYELDTMSSVYNQPYWLHVVKITGLNSRVDSCPVDDNVCTPAGPRPSITIPGYNNQTYTDSLGNVTSVTKSSSVLSVQVPGVTSPQTYNFNGFGQVTSATVAGISTSYSYVDSGGQRTTTRVSPAGTEVYKFDQTTSQLREYTDGLLNKTVYSYNGSNQLTGITMPDGNAVQYTPDARGNKIQTVLVPKTGSGLANITTSATYPATCTNLVTCNKPITTTDQFGNVTSYTYDPAHGGATIVTSPAVGGVSPQTRYTYTNLTNIWLPLYRLTGISACQTTASCAGTADEVKTTIAYGTMATNNFMPQSVSTGAGNGSLTATSAVTYDALGNVATVDGPLAGTADTSMNRYDGMGRPLGTVSPDPDGGGPLKARATRVTYHANGFVASTEIGTDTTPTSAGFGGFTPLQTSTATHDPATGRKTQSSVSAGGTIDSIEQYSYDSAGRLDCAAQRMNPAVYGSLPAPSTACTGYTAGSFGPDRIVKNGYDGAGRVNSVTSAYGTAAAQTETRDYTANGQVRQVSDGKGNTTAYTYDGFDRLSRTCYLATSATCAGSPADYEQISYNPTVNVTVRRLRDGQTITYTNDNLGRPAARSYSTGHPTISYAYDNLGHTISATQTGNALSFTYDALGRNLSQAGPLGTVSYLYDLAGRRTRVTLPGSSTLYSDYDYLVTGEVSAVRENGASSGVGVLAIYTYDDLGRRTAITRGNGTTTGYSFNAVSRLASLTQDLGGSGYDSTWSFSSYNPVGQIMSSSRSNDAYAWNGYGNVDRDYTTNGLNQYTASGAVAPTYDTKGNLTSGGPTVYDYSSENQLKTASGGITLDYDPLLRLYQTAGGVAGTTRRAYDGVALIAEYDGSGNVLRRYLHGPGTDEPLVWYEGPGTADRRWLHADERGSVAAITDAAGSTLAINRYDEFGIPAATNIGRFQYTGQTWLPELGMYYYKARIYSPTLGRFTQTDPNGYGDGMNLYNYVGNDPVNNTDPTGLCYRDGSSSAVAIEEFERCMTARAMAAAGSYLSDSAEGAGFAQAAMDGYEASRNLNGFYSTYAEGIASEAAAEQLYAEVCPGRYNCGNTTTLETARKIVALLRNPEFRALSWKAWLEANATHKEHAFAGVGYENFRMTYGLTFGAKDGISFRTVERMAAGGAVIFFHTHQNNGSGYVPSLSATDLRHIRQFNFLGLVLSHNGWYFYDATKPGR